MSRSITFSLSAAKIELGITLQILYRHLDPDGVLRQDGQKLLER